MSNKQRDVENFIRVHKGLAADVALLDADFWSDAQASFLQEAIIDDSDWAEIVDSLDAQLT